MSGRDKGFWKRIDRRWPWLKIAEVPFCGFLIIFWVIFGIKSASDVVVDERDLEAPTYDVRVTKDYTGKKLVALTFDDGPSPTTTPELLDILMEKDVYATFFELGSLVEKYPEITKRVVAEGHELGSHTQNHKQLSLQSANTIDYEVDTANEVFLETVGFVPEIMRPPYGAFNSTVKQRADAAMIIWNVDTLDWKIMTTDSIMYYLSTQVCDGAVILMHDIHPTTIAAVPTVIDYLRSEGYEFVTVSELAEIKGVELEEGKAYYRF